MVVEAKDKYQPVVLMLMMCLVQIVGCGSDSSPKNVDQAINRAVSQLEMYGGSQAVCFWGRVPSTLPAMQTVKQTCDGQTKNFVQSLDNLKKFADQTVDDNRQAKKAAFAKWLTGAMMLYQGKMDLDQVKVLDARQANVKDKVLVSYLEVRLLKSQKEAVSPTNFDSAIQQSQEAIAGQKKNLDVAQGQLSGVDSTLKSLKADLAKAEKERDDLNIQVGSLTAKLANVPAAEAVELQKKVNELEKKRFAVLVTVQKLEAGPLTLSDEHAVTVGDRKLTEVSGISQIEAEKAFLETRISKVEEGIKAQETYLQNLEQQKKIAEQKVQELAKQYTAASERLKADLQALSVLFTERSGLVDKADKDLSGSSRYAQQADSDLKRYLAAVQEAASGAAGESDYLKGAKGLDELSYSIGTVRADAQLSQLRLKMDDAHFMESVIKILEGCQTVQTLPSNLTEVVKEGPAKVKAMNDDAVKTVESIVTQYETLYRAAARSALKPIIGADLVEATSLASSLNPEKAKDYQAKMKDFMKQILPEGTAVNSDPLLVPARKLQQTLGL